MSVGEHRVLALKWRPVKFAEVIGQPHVVKTLVNELSQGTVAQAYLFGGPRGVGKTTCARILARAVNCEKGMGPEPCGECGTCKEILAGRALDVIEIDAGSTGSVEHVRDLNEVVRLVPIRARKKVFIFDEAHKLSTPAANALLKTLEEPPAHVLFILASTEARSMIATIQSRCQRFDFLPLGMATLVNHLKEIARIEKIEIDEAALSLIARFAGGAMRDAQQLLEQSAAFAPGRVSAVEVRSLLGLVEHEWVDKFLDVLRRRDVAGGLKLLDNLIEAGRDPAELLKEGQEELRDILMKRLGADVASVSGVAVSEERMGWFAEEELLGLLTHMRRAIEEISFRTLSHPRIVAELAVARLLRRERAISWADVESRLKEIEGAITAGGGAAAAGPAAERVAAAEVPSAQDAGGGNAGRPALIPLGEVIRRWAEFLERVKEESPVAHTYLRNTRPVAVESDMIILESDSEFHRQGLSGGDAKAAVEGVLGSIMGSRVRVSVRLPASAAGTPVPTIMDSPEWISREPLVKSALEVFKARILELKKPQ